MGKGRITRYRRNIKLGKINRGLLNTLIADCALLHARSFGWNAFNLNLRLGEGDRMHFPVSDKVMASTSHSYRITICDSVCVSSGISRSLLFVPLRGSKNFTPWKPGLVTVGSVRVQAFCCESAAFFKESIIREIITGRYLKHRL